MPSAPAADQKTLETWRHYWQDEADAAFLYEVLASVEPAPERRELYKRLERVEDRHQAIWRKLLLDHEVDVGQARPSSRARLIAWLARRIGPAAPVSILLREEGREVKGYLSLHRESAYPAVRDAALTLARESAEHAETLGTLAGRQGEPWHRAESGGTLGNLVYGFNDGLTANFGLVAGVIGAAVEPHIVLVTGMAGMIADALSMGSSGYLAAKSEEEVYAHEIAMEREEIRLMPELEEEELALLYEAKGIEGGRARSMAHDVMREPERALDEKVREELKINPAHSSPLRQGWVTGGATAVGALIPVAPFMVLSGGAAMWSSFAVAMLSHFAVGAARSIFTGRGLIRSGFDMFAVGLGVAGVGYIVGDLIGRW